VLRIHFTAEDLARVRISASWGPLAETLFSLSVLGERAPSSLVAGWREEMGHRVGSRAQPLLRLVQPFAHVDLITVAGQAESMDEALDALLGASDARLDDELEPLRAELLGNGNSNAFSWARAWVGALSEGDLEARKQLVSSLREYSRLAIDPYWEGLRAHINADRAMRGRLMAEGGVELLLATLHPNILWRAPVLEVLRPPAAQAGRPAAAHTDVHLAGRSVVLVPSVFCLRNAMLFCDPMDEAAPYVLFYPALREADDAMAVWTPEASRRPALEALLGRTRSMALEAIADLCTTTELARRIGTSPSTASHHATVLRDAGLITSRRDGTAVLHQLTERGASLLDQPPRRARMSAG
jgi:DNA-binding transcriptional ArsR family regulator